MCLVISVTQTPCVSDPACVWLMMAQTNTRKGSIRRVSQFDLLGSLYSFFFLYIYNFTPK